MGSSRCDTPTIIISAHPTSATWRCVASTRSRSSARKPECRLCRSTTPSTRVEARNASAMATAHHVSSRDFARGSELARLPTARTMPTATSAMPAWCSIVVLVATPAANSPAPGANVQKLACATRTERNGAPSATGRSW